MESMVHTVLIHLSLALAGAVMMGIIVYFALKSSSYALSGPSRIVLPQTLTIAIIGFGLWFSFVLTTLSGIQPEKWTFISHWLIDSLLAVLVTSALFTLISHRSTTVRLPWLILGALPIGATLAACQWLLLACFASGQEWTIYPLLFVFSATFNFITALGWLLSKRWYHQRRLSGYYPLGITVVTTGLLTTSIWLTLLSIHLGHPYQAQQKIHLAIYPENFAYYASLFVFLLAVLLVVWSSIEQLLHRRQPLKNLFMGTVMENLSTAVLACDKDGKLLFFNQAMKTLLEEKAEICRLPEAGKQQACQSILETLKHHLQDSLQGEERRNISFEIAYNLHHRKFYTLNSQRILDSDQHLQGAALTLIDVTELHETLTKQEKLLAKPTVMNLPGQKQLIEYLDTTHQVGDSKHPLSLLLINLDDFKTVINSYGHSIANELLSMVAERFSKLIMTFQQSVQDNKEYFLAHLGGDQFALVLNHFENHQLARSVAEKILDELNIPFMLNGTAYYLRCSIGMTSEPFKTQNEDLVTHAEIALYRSKQAGKHTITSYSPEIQAFFERQLKLRNDLSIAIQQDQLTLVYQPQCSLTTGALRGFEVLLRWQHPVLGPISPDEIISLAEKTDQIILLDQWVLEHALQQVKNWQHQRLIPLDVKFAINISVRELANPRFIPFLNTLLERYSLSTCSLELELTETALLFPSEQIAITIDWLTKHGVSLSLDDFGTGYSSLSRLKEFPLNMLKIDKAFVKHITEDVLDIEISRTIIELTKSLNIAVLAEGTETEAQVKDLIQLGCQYGQGYYFSKPLTKDDVPAFLQRASVKNAH